MGAPKQKWTEEEEAALKAGVHKHGPGKWRTILTDPEFRAILHMRSNVDLKDKWRNINVTAVWGSRQKARLAALKKSPLTPKHDNSLALSVLKTDEDIVDDTPLAITNGTLDPIGSQECVKRLDSLIVEAIAILKEPSGSDRAAIAAYIEEQYWAPPNLKKLLSAKLKNLLANGKLIRVKHRYRIAINSRFSDGGKSISRPTLEGRQKEDYPRPRAEKIDLRIFTKSQIEEELNNMRSMTAQEAAVAAARAVAEAEAAIAAAEEAAREAEAAEAEAEAAQVVAQAAMNNALRFRAVAQ